MLLPLQSLGLFANLISASLQVSSECGRANPNQTENLITCVPHLCRFEPRSKVKLLQELHCGWTIGCVVNSHARQPRPSLMFALSQDRARGHHE